MAPNSYDSRSMAMNSPYLERRGEGTPSMVITTRIVVIIVASLSLIVCSLRLYVRKFIRKVFGIDDILVIIALLFVLGFAALSITISYRGLGRRQVTVSEEDLLVFLKIYYVALCTYLAVACAVKISLATFLMRIFPNYYIQIAGKSMIAFLLAFGLSGEFALIFQCKPVKAGYDKTIITAKCYSNGTTFAILLYQGILMFLADLVLIILPMPILWKLQMPLNRRLILMGLFSCGGIACIASLVRFTTLVYTKDTTDYTYSAAASLIWMNLEYNLGLIAGSLSSLRPLFKMDAFWSSNGGSNGPSQQKSGSRGYELNNANWRNKGITKTSEIMMTTQEEVARTESQERIVPKWDKMTIGGSTSNKS